MPKFEVWFRKEFDGRAPEAAWLDTEYEWAGELDAFSVKDLQRILAAQTPEEPKLETPRPLRTGDVVRPHGTTTGWMLTPVGLWAQVMTFENPAT